MSQGERAALYALVYSRQRRREGAGTCFIGRRRLLIAKWRIEEMLSRYTTPLVRTTSRALSSSLKPTTSTEKRPDATTLTKDQLQFDDVTHTGQVRFGFFVIVNAF